MQRIVIPVLLFFICCVLMPPPSAGQNTLAPSMTVDALVKDAGAMVEQLKSFKLKIDANVNVTVDPSIAGNLKIAADGIIAGLNAQIDQLRQLVNNDLSKQISQLNAGTAETARSLNSAVQRASLLLQNQQQSLLVSGQVLLSGLETVALELKQVVPFRSKDEPRLYYFGFAGTPPSSVPKNGGTVELFGYDIWPKNAPRAPKAELVTDTSLVKTFDPKHASGPNSVTIEFPAALVTANAGKCLRFHITTFRKRFLHGAESFDLSLPVCIAQTFTTQFVISGTLAYECTGPKTSELPAAQHKFFRWDNPACNTKITVGDVKHWDSEIAPGCKIVSYRTVNHEEQLEGSNVNLSITGRTDVSASGTVTSPQCVTVKIPPFGPTIERLLKVAVWATDILPSVECTASQEVTNTADSAITDATLPTTRACIHIPSSCPAGQERKNDLTAFSFSVTPIISGVKKPVLYTSARVTGGNTGATSPLEVKQGLGFEGALNTTPVSGKFEVCGSVTAAQ